MADYKGKGLTPEQLEIFNENEKIFNNDYQGYIKSLLTPQEREFAQLRRKYQSTFVSQDEVSAFFTHKFSNPDEFSERLSKHVKRKGTISFIIMIPVKYFEIGCTFEVKDDFDENYKFAFEEELKKISSDMKSPFQAMKYFDNHIQAISAKVLSSVQEIKTIDRKAQYLQLLEKAKAAKEKYTINPVVPTPVQKHEDINEKPKEEEEKKHVNQNEKEQLSQDFFNAVAAEEEDKISSSKIKEEKFANIAISKTALKILAKQLTFRNLGSASLMSLSIEVECTRCQTRTLRKTFPSEIGLATGDNIFIDSFQCTCTLPLSFELKPAIIFPKSGRQLSTGKFCGCVPLDFVEMDYKFTCPDCGEFTSLNNAKNYTPHIIVCQSCFSKGTFQVDGVTFESFTENPEDKEKNGLVGKPLPKNGVCKHFKYSFRWFKFPCCQRLFPCMICHDDNTDHPSQKGELYVCGFCGSLQKLGGKEVCKKCGSSVNGLEGNKRFWEGGKGCRNADKMSRNDKRKHRGKK